MIQQDWFADETPVPIKNPVKGYAARPGSGPAGETCGSCFHASQVSGYWKCAAVKHRWSHGLGSDIRLKSPACSQWKSWRDSPEYLILLSLITRAPKDAEPRDWRGVHASAKDMKALDKLLWVVPTARERAMLQFGMFIRGEGHLVCASSDGTKWMVEVK